MRFSQRLRIVGTVAALVLGMAAAPGAAGPARADPRPRADARQAQVLVLPGRAGNGTHTAITCFVQAFGPDAPQGLAVFFGITINCVGGVPQRLGISMDMAWYDFAGNPIVLPSSVSNCLIAFSPVLACGSEARCGNSGYYDGLGRIFGVDEFGIVHTTTVYSPPRYLSCAV